ncbi:hypothetical protein ACF0H5_007103 [Mactra antiquata]
MKFLLYRIARRKVLDTKCPTASTEQFPNHQVFMSPFSHVIFLALEVIPALEGMSSTNTINLMFPPP